MIRLQYSRLCCLIHNNLHSFTAKPTVSMTKEEEKSLLITLSQVLSKIKLWIAEFDSDSDSDSNSDNDDHGDPLIHISICPHPASECILKITNNLVSLLTVDNHYAQHLAGNVLVNISEFVIASGSYWEEFVQSIYIIFEIIICNAISPSSNQPIRAKHLDYESSNFNPDLQSVGAIISVLRTILKQIKHEDDDDKILEIYLKALGSCLHNIPWDSVIIPEIEFCGYIVQLLCSMVSQSNPQETLFIQEIFSIFPKILTWCFDKQGQNRNYTCISQYIRHKILVLMIRLSSLIQLDCKTIFYWLNLVNKYFQDLLFESLTESDCDQYDCVKDSPFNDTSNRHLQRRAIFLYLKCSFSLINFKEKCNKQCLCGDLDSCSKKGFTAIYEWLQKHLPANILVNFELYDDNCKRFTKSFLQLYMHEDDMLFKVLLQLTYTQQMSENWSSEKNIILLISDIFDPVQLFHLFLSELHYDHQVLLDYLISKDIGASCAEYLLRCLRIICEKWTSFLGFPIRVQQGNQSFYKRRKITNDGIPKPSKMDHKNENNCKQPFNDARDCLLLLKKSVESLHQKDLFPYNPQVLLRRLTRFQELCSSDRV